jgi:hypothetical protein
VAAGSGHVCALTAEGTLLCWRGDDSYGELDAPDGQYVAVSSGSAFSCALRADGAVACWGYDQSGQASPPTGTFLQIAAGTQHACGLRTDGTLACWGDNWYGQTNAPSGTFTDVYSGDYQSCAFRADGEFVCWGAVPSGGAGGQLSSTEPRSVSAGNTQLCAVSSSGVLDCWGSDCIPGYRGCADAATTGLCGVRSEWTELEACTDQACVQGVCQGECEPGDRRCVSDRVEVCDAAGAWQVSDVCDHGCATEQPWPQCRACDTGVRQCSGIIQQECDATGFFVDLGACPSACVDGQCVTGAECSYRDQRCVSGSLETCASDGTWAVSKSCPEGCDSGGEDCYMSPECALLLACCPTLSGGYREGCYNLVELSTASNCTKLLGTYECFQ